MVTRIGDEVTDILIHSDRDGFKVYGGKQGTNYTICGQHGFTCELLFQNGAFDLAGVNGITLEALLAILIHRTRVLNAQFPCSENGYAIQHMEEALAHFEARTARRALRGVRGAALV